MCVRVWVGEVLATLATVFTCASTTKPQKQTPLSASKTINSFEWGRTIFGSYCQAITIATGYSPNFNETGGGHCGLISKLISVWIRPPPDCILCMI